MNPFLVILIIFSLSPICYCSDVSLCPTTQSYLSKFKEFSPNQLNFNDCGFLRITIINSDGEATQLSWQIPNDDTKQSNLRVRRLKVINRDEALCEGDFHHEMVHNALMVLSCEKTKNLIDVLDSIDTELLNGKCWKGEELDSNLHVYELIDSTSVVVWERQSPLWITDEDVKSVSKMRLASELKLTMLAEMLKLCAYKCLLPHK